jgi:hypothetical protein
VARTWLQIRVDLLGGAAWNLDPSPGRILIVGPGHSFEQLADAINQAFARWDLSGDACHIRPLHRDQDRVREAVASKGRTPS